MHLALMSNTIKLKIICERTRNCEVSLQYVDLLLIYSMIVVVINIDLHGACCIWVKLFARDIRAIIIAIQKGAFPSSMFAICLPLRRKLLDASMLLLISAPRNKMKREEHTHCNDCNNQRCKKSPNPNTSPHH